MALTVRGFRSSCGRGLGDMPGSAQLVKGAHASRNAGYRRAMIRNASTRTDPAPRDPTRMRSQAQLTSASGTTWVVVAAVSAVLLGTMLLIGDGFGALGIAACVVLAVLLVSMWQVRALVRERRVRLVVLAVLYATMLVAALGATLAIAAGPAR